LTRLHERGRKIRALQAIRRAPDVATAQRVLMQVLPAPLASAFLSELPERVLQRLRQLPEPGEHPRLTGRDWRGASGVGLLGFLSTFPIVMPFILIGDAKLALRVSNAVAIAMLFVCGCAFGRRAGLRAPAAGLAMVVAGGAFVGVAIALGG